MNCENCAFYFGAMKECRRFPPQLLNVQMIQDGIEYWDHVSRFPDTEKTDLCGEYKPAPR
jgi:hypothetical protein